MKFLNILFFTSVTLSVSVAFSYEFGDNAHLGADTITKYIPPEVKTSAINAGQDSVYGKDLSVDTEILKFKRRRGSEYAVALYNNSDSCAVVVLKKSKNGYTLMPKSELQEAGMLDQCTDLEIKDLNLDGVPELIINTIADKRPGPPIILKWHVNHLVDITPVEKTGATVKNALRTTLITDKPIKGRLEILDYSTDDPASKRRIYYFDGERILLDGEYDYVTIIPSSGIKNQGNSAIAEAYKLTPTFESDGEYTLTVKNVSDHNRSVRAEVTVNGSVVLKPQDFCSAPPQPKKDRKWWKGHDDDDDHDEDHHKRCVPKLEAYAIVNMKTANEIKVKVYGRKDSKVQLTLVKK